MSSFVLLAKLKEEFSSPTRRALSYSTLSCFVAVAASAAASSNFSASNSNPGDRDGLFLMIDKLLHLHLAWIFFGPFLMLLLSSPPSWLPRANNSWKRESEATC